MAQSAYIKLVEGSATQTITLDEVKKQLEHYIEQVSKTGTQLSWHYSDAAFPYTFETKPDNEGQWFYLKGKDDKLYRYLIFGVGSETYEVEVTRPIEDGDESEEETTIETRAREFIQIVIPDGATHGDKSKANEYCKFIAKELKAELQMFNGRVMYFNPRK